MFDLHDTIAAIASAPGWAARGIVRVSGPQAFEIVAKSFVSVDNSPPCGRRSAHMVGGMLWGELKAPCDLFLWPTERSYTRQPIVEIHTFGSGPVLDSILADVCRHGARLAEPGEFTLRAFLAGRIDLTQAEAVLGVIDARGEEDLDAALVQLAGGLSRPLVALREQLVGVVAELEAGLDFAEEDIQFISRDQLRHEVDGALRSVSAIIAQVAERDTADGLPRVLLSGPPNAGKSSLFNALTQRWGAARTRSVAIVSPVPGTTRDYLVGKLDLDGVACELVDTAGVEPDADRSTLAGVAQQLSGAQRRRADLVVHCRTAEDDGRLTEPGIRVCTKSDLGSSNSDDCACSSRTGEGLAELCAAIRRSLINRASQGAVASTSMRCAESLRHAKSSLTAAVELVDARAGEELVAAEIRQALAELGRVVGTVYTDDLLDRIFSQFCIGK